MQLKKFYLSTCFCLISSVPSAYAGPEDAWQLLQKTALAARELDYQGLFLYQNAAIERSVKITHMNSGGQELTKNIVLDGNPREVFSEGGQIVIFNAKQDKVVIEKRRGHNLFPAMLPTDLSALKSSYVAKLNGKDRVAGRMAQVIDLIPMDSYRYAYRIWSDLDYGLLLKMTMMDAQQKNLEQIGFTQLNLLSTRDLNWYQPRIDLSKNYVMEDAPDATHVTDTLQVSNLPPGYRQVDQIRLQVPGKPMPVNQFIFSDGIASVSLFVEPLLKGVAPRVGVKMMGATNMCANVISGYQLVVVGEVPADTVQEIARAVTLKNTQK